MNASTETSTYNLGVQNLACNFIFNTRKAASAKTERDITLYGRTVMLYTQ